MGQSTVWTVHFPTVGSIKLFFFFCRSSLDERQHMWKLKPQLSQLYHRRQKKRKEKKKYFLSGINPGATSDLAVSVIKFFSFLDSVECPVLIFMINLFAAERWQTKQPV